MLIRKETKEELEKSLNKLSDEDNFVALYQKKNIEVDLPTIEYNSDFMDENGMYSLIDCIFITGKYKSKSEVRRLIQQGAVKINGKKVNDLLFEPQTDMIISVGKGNTFKLMTKESNLTKKLIK